MIQSGTGPIRSVWTRWACWAWQVPQTTLVGSPAAVYGGEIAASSGKHPPQSENPQSTDGPTLPDGPSPGAESPQSALPRRSARIKTRTDAQGLEEIYGDSDMTEVQGT
ncbi:hypothetical protein GWK47_001738 [Chionoecetes opilio]|uniref:Uncharacterized protein n=1 Tax=Chionoecetes opilio TaxID=41210 RepID=A0A8J4XS90_CHIOP|nr:hypothetical protein GWK47_001738 [Chionoecetes opilio]